MDPSAFPDIVLLWDLYGQDTQDHTFYLIRTYAYYLHRERHMLLGTWNDMAPFDQLKKAKRGPKLKTNANSSSISAIYTVTPDLPNDVTCSSALHQPVIAHQLVPESDQNVASEHHDVYPATDVRNSHDSDVRFGGQYGAWSGGGGAGSSQSVHLARGVPEPSAHSHTDAVLCTSEHVVPRVPPTLLTDDISPLPEYGQSGVCGTGAGSVGRGLPQPLPH